MRSATREACQHPRRIAKSRRPRRGAWRRLLLVAALLSAVAASAQRDPAPPPLATVHRVRAGESLWLLAGKLPTTGDRRAGVWLLRSINDLSSNSISPGQQLLLPADASSQRRALRSPAKWRQHAVPVAANTS